MKGLKEIVMAVSVLGALAAPAFSAATKSQQLQQQPATRHLQVARQPNLVIRTVVPFPGDDRKLVAVIANIGGAGAGPCNLKLLYFRSSGFMAVNTSVPAIPAGGHQAFLVDVKSPIAFAQSVHLRVDDPDVVAETSELDNAFAYK
jgi:hypothetical protein